VLRGIFGPKKEDMTGGWRKLHEEIYNIYYHSPSTADVKKGGAITSLLHMSSWH
jgi:hypothetical protein